MSSTPPPNRSIQRWLPCIAVALPAGAVWTLAWHPGFYYLAHILVLAMLWLVAPVFLAVGTALQSRLRSASPEARFARSGWVAAGLILVGTTVAVLGRVPLRVSFALARPGLERLVEERRTTPNWTMKADERVGPFVISATRTNVREARMRGASNCGTPARAVFVLADDGEAAFIHDPSGIEDLCYNAGSKGHLMGPWHSMKED